MWDLKHNQMGLTLIELLLSVAIFSIIMVSLVSFMTVISRQYTKSNNEVNVQNEVQTLMAHLQDLIVSANTNIGIDGNRIVMVDDDTFEVIEYDAANEYLYYYSLDQLGATEADKVAYTAVTDRDEKFKKAKELLSTYSIATGDSKVNSYLMTEYVSAFAIDATHITDNYIAISLTLSKNNVHYTASKNIYLRNSLYDVDVKGLASGVGSTGAAEESASASEEGAGGGGAGGGAAGGDDTDATASSADSIQIPITDPPSTEGDTVKATSITAAYTGGTAYYGDTLSRNDFTVTVHYSDGSSKNVTDWETDSSYNVTNSYSFDVHYYDGQRVNTNVYITMKDLTSISVAYVGSEKSEGDVLTKDDFNVYNVYSDGTKKLTDQWTCTALNQSLSTGNTTIQIYSSVKTWVKDQVVVAVKLDVSKLGTTEEVELSDDGMNDVWIDTAGAKQLVITFSYAPSYEYVNVQYDNNGGTGIQNGSVDGAFTAVIDVSGHNKTKFYNISDACVLESITIVY
jgi:type II secretory pathway pseudopilin PulG